jgi:hypothetical protein
MELMTAFCHPRPGGGRINLAINSSNAVWPITVNGNIPTVPTAPVQGYGGQPIPAVFAQGYQGIDGSHCLLVTNKSNQSLQFAIVANGNFWNSR